MIADSSMGKDARAQASREYAVPDTQAEERFALVLDVTEDGVWEWRPQANESFFSARWKQMLGYEDHEIPNRQEEWAIRCHPDDVEWATAAFLEHLTNPSNTIHHIEYRMRHRDGSWRWWRSRGRVIRDASGVVTRAVGVNTDITEQRLARERTDQLLAVGAALSGAMTTGDVADAILMAARPIFQASMGIVALLAEDGVTLRTVRVSGESAQQMLPCSECSLNTRIPLADAVRERRLVLLAPDAVGEALAAVPLLAGGRALGGLVLICPRERCLDAEQQTFLLTLASQCALALERARLYDDALRETHIREQAQQALRESEARKSAMLEAALDSIITIDADEIVLEWNPAAERTFGYTRAETLGRPLSELIVPAAMRSEHGRGIAHYHQTGEGPVLNRRLEVTAVRKDGVEMPVEMTTVPIAVGGRTMFTAYLRDLTERKTLEAERERALREAEDQADRDPLTGLLNHRAFHKRLEEEAARVQRDGAPLTVVMIDLDNFKFFNDVYGHSVGDDVLRQFAHRLQSICRPYDSIARFGGDEFALLLPSSGAGPASDIEERLRDGLENIVHCPRGQLSDIPITVSFGIAAFGQLDTDWHEVVALANERLRRAKTGGAAETEAESVRASMVGRIHGFSMLDALVTAVDNKDRYTRRHSEDVMRYSVMIAEELGLDDKTRHTVAVSALLHDVGKIGVPDAVLRKPGKLIASEFEAVQQHPMMGAIMVGAAPGLEDTLDAVRHHHERWDGAGYPFGLKGEETPLIARLMAVADAFSAMTTDRPYRKGMSRVVAQDILAAGSGAQWDPQCVRAFLRAMERDDAKAA